MVEVATRLYLITPPLDEVTAFIPAFEAALDAGDVACVFLRTQLLAEGTVKKIVTNLAPRAQKRDAAVLVADPLLAARCGADGVHVVGLGQPFESALASMKPDRIVGIGGLASRHDAMLAGDAGADYVMFGGASDVLDAAAIFERTAWWAEIFTLPCVAYAHELADVSPLARAGADFVAVGDAIWQYEFGAAAAVAIATEALANAREPIA